MPTSPPPPLLRFTEGVAVVVVDAPPPRPERIQDEDVQRSNCSTNVAQLSSYNFDVASATMATVLLLPPLLLCGDGGVSDSSKCVMKDTILT